MIIDHEYLAFDALSLMNSKKISQLIVTKDGEYMGMVHTSNFKIRDLG